jgi:hypothetical protein
MTYIVAIFAVCAFAVGLRLSRLTALACAARDAALLAWATLRDAKVSDAEKERVARRTAVAMLACAARLLLRLGGALAAAALIAFAASAFGVTSPARLAEALESWPFVVIGSLASLALIGK